MSKTLFYFIGNSAIAQGNMDKQGENILIQIIYGDGDWKTMMKKGNVRATIGNNGHNFGAGGMEGCITPEDIAGMRDMDIREADAAMLADIMEVEISEDLSDAEKKSEFIRQIKNPYLYKQGEYMIKLRFADTETTLTDCLKEYIEHMAALEFHDL